MAQILISESHPSVRRLLMRMTQELGHEPLSADTPAAAEDIDGVALLIVEPADPASALLAKTARTYDPDLPIVCVSVLDTSRVNIEFDAFLSKPFTFAQLATAIELALTPSASRRATV
jgi:CheY-like chemotaxis protein